MTDALTQAAEEQVDMVLQRCFDGMRRDGLNDRQAEELCELSRGQIAMWRGKHTRPNALSLFKFAYGMGVSLC